MLLRSSSTPILRSWISSNYNTNSSSPNINELTVKATLLRTNTISTFTTSSPPLSPNVHHSRRPTCTTLFESNLGDQPRPTTTTLQRMFSSSGLDKEVSVAEDGDNDGGGSDGDGIGINGGDWHGGGGYGFNDRNSSNNNNEYEKMETYFQKMIKTNPGDPLLLGNYARFLKEERGNLAKAEEYCERAILGSPSDANILSLYADIIWQHRKDAQRADSYYNQAIKTAPNDCYVHASYARFLWDVGEEDLEEEVNQEEFGDNPSPSPPHYLEEVTTHRTPSFL